jgi:hypothetical protein
MTTIAPEKVKMVSPSCCFIEHNKKNEINFLATPKIIT